MNAKAERIDQIIQIVNRNLLLIFAGQPEGVTPLDSRNLQRIDVNVFGGDKFAYEMVNFIKTSPKITSTSLAAQWDRNFLKGLETLIVECAVVKDEVERECFVSRVYVWFSDKLTERRDLPMHIMGKEEIKSLTDIISNVGGKHTVKALENYSASIPTAAPEEETVAPETAAAVPPRQADMTLPSLRRRSQQPAYIQHTYPSLFEAVPSYMNNPNDMHGLMNYNPETEAEKVMNELWIARRRQEAFEYKAQQNIALIMDRRALNKSRMESEALRRAETSTFLADHEPPADYDTATKFAPKIQRPLSGRRQYSNVMNYSEANDQSAKIVVAKGSSKVETNVQSTNRLVVEKPPSAKKEVLPMKFKMEWPDSVKDRKVSKDDTNISSAKDDSDDEKPVVRSRPHSTQPTRSKAAAATPLRGRVVHLAADKPHSAHQMRNMARTDGEYQVHYKFSTLRRMPYTPEMRAWVDKREEQRVKNEKEYEKRLIEAEAENSKGKGGKGGKGDKKNVAAAKPNKKTADKPPPAPKPKYSSAADFMEQHFPRFDSDMYSQGPYRRHQLLEVARVYDALSEYYPDISEETIKKALVVPQDRPESICLENLKDSLEGLMENPLPVEFWRKCVTDVPETKKKKKGKKKKA